jgi:hypothetical protein
MCVWLVQVLVCLALTFFRVMNSVPGKQPFGHAMCKAQVFIQFFWRTAHAIRYLNESDVPCCMLGVPFGFAA